jgi:hypothetical protein
MVVAERQQTRMRCTNCDSTRRKIGRFVMLAETGPERFMYICRPCYAQLSRVKRVSPIERHHGLDGLERHHILE